MTQMTTEKTIEAYDKHAAKYAEKFDSYAIYQEKITTFQQRYIPGSAHILDLGCGPGNNIQTILSNDSTCTFTGVDLSSSFLQIAKQRFAKFEFIQEDIRELTLEKRYDVILASFCIVHLIGKETEAFLRSVSHLLNRGGVLYLSYMNGDDSGFESTSFSEDPLFFKYYDDQFIIDRLQDNGIEIMEILKEDYHEQDGTITTDTFIYAYKS